jgi:site-specific recombinase XerD
MLRERQEGVDWVFPSDSATGHLLDVRRTFNAVCKMAKVEEFRLHDLRRTHASILINSGISIMQVRDILGHSDIRTTQIYTRLSTSALEAASEAASKEISKALGKVA